MMQSNQTTPEGGDSCGARLRQAREQAGMSREQVSARLKMPVRVIDALESDDWAVIGAPVFVRGQLRSYARLMRIDLEADLVQAQVGPVAPPELVSHSHIPRYRHLLEQGTRRAVYIAITAVIAVPVWLATHPHLSNDPQVESLDVPASLAEASRPEPAAPPQRTPLIASMGTMRGAPAQRQSAPALSLAFEGESWVQVFAPDGSSLEKGLLDAGDRRTYDKGEVGRIVLGNTSAVKVLSAGEPVDLAPFSRANVARFTLSSDGSLAPVVD